MWSVEVAGSDDAAAILEVQKAAFSRNQAKYSATLPAMAETVDELLADMKGVLVLVARQSDDIVGSARCRMGGTEWEVYKLAVHPGFAHLDVGRSLMGAIEDRAREAGAETIFLETGLRDAPAIEFYLNLGYRPFALAPDDETHIDMVQFRKHLSSE